MVLNGRESSQSPNGLALLNANNPHECDHDVRDNLERPNSPEKNGKPSKLKSPNFSSQRPVLKDIANNSTLYQMKKKDFQPNNSSQSRSSKPIKTYLKSAKDFNKLLTNNTKELQS